MVLNHRSVSRIWGVTNTYTSWWSYFQDKILKNHSRQWNDRRRKNHSPWKSKCFDIFVTFFYIPTLLYHTRSEIFPFPPWYCRFYILSWWVSPGTGQILSYGEIGQFFFLIFSEVRGVRLGGARLLIWARQRREKEEIHSAAREGILTDKDDVTAGRNRKGKPSEIFNRNRTLK